MQELSCRPNMVDARLIINLMSQCLDAEGFLKSLHAKTHGNGL